MLTCCCGVQSVRLRRSRMSSTVCLKLRLGRFCAPLFSSRYTVRHGRQNFTWQLFGTSNQRPHSFGGLSEASIRRIIS